MFHISCKNTHCGRYLRQGERPASRNLTVLGENVFFLQACSDRRRLIYSTFRCVTSVLELQGIGLLRERRRSCRLKSLGT